MCLKFVASRSLGHGCIFGAYDKFLSHMTNSILFFLGSFKVKLGYF